MNWLAKFIPPFLKRREFTPVATYVYPCGVWGTLDTVTGKSETRGVLYSTHVFAENESGKLVHAHEWIPGPDLTKRPELST